MAYKKRDLKNTYLDDFIFKQIKREYWQTRQEKQRWSKEDEYYHIAHKNSPYDDTLNELDTYGHVFYVYYY